MFEFVYNKNMSRESLILFTLTLQKAYNLEQEIENGDNYYIKVARKRDMVLDVFKDVYFDKGKFEFVEYSDESKKALYRGLYGIDMKEYYRCLKSDNFNVYRIGHFGYGTYFSSDYNVALSYADYEREGVIHANLDENARFMDINSFKKITKEFFKQLNDLPEYRALDKKTKKWASKYLKENYQLLVTIFSKIYGFDGIRSDKNRPELEIVCLTNPGAVKIVNAENSNVK